MLKRNRATTLLLVLLTFGTSVLTLAFFAAASPTEAAGTGNGLSATYYNSRTLSGTTVTRTDPTINFNWGTGAPAGGIGADNFSVRWTGQVQPLYSQTYTFYTTSDDGVRLWVNDQLLINNWTDHAPVENSASIALSAGQKYNLKLEFYENGGGAVSKLAWSSASQIKQIIPQSQLYSTSATATPTPTVVVPPTATPTPGSSALDSEEAAFLNLINQYRQSKGVGALKLNQNLINASKWMSQDMGAKNYFSHTDSLGRDPFTRMADFGYTFNTYKAENIAAGYNTAASVMTGWQNSAGHNQNMLNPNYTVIGIGRAYTPGSTYGWYWTTDFGGQ